MMKLYSITYKSMKPSHSVDTENVLVCKM